LLEVAEDSGTILSTINLSPFLNSKKTRMDPSRMHYHYFMALFVSFFSFGLAWWNSFKSVEKKKENRPTSISIVLVGGFWTQ